MAMRAFTRDGSTVGAVNERAEEERASIVKEEVLKADEVRSSMSKFKGVAYPRWGHGAPPLR